LKVNAKKYLKKNNHIEMLIASREVEGNYGPGQGCCITGKGEIHTSGKLARMATSKFPWARGALVIKVEEVKTQL